MEIPPRVPSGHRRTTAPPLAHPRQNAYEGERQRCRLRDDTRCVERKRNGDRVPRRGVRAEVVGQLSLEIIRRGQGIIDAAWRTRRRGQGYLSV